MEARFAQLPQALRRQSIHTTLAGRVPALLAHPESGWMDALEAGRLVGDDIQAAPVVIWMHGRTVSKELDPGRYLRWTRAGIATCALDLPFHGERADPDRQSPGHTLRIVEQMADELDDVVADLSERFAPAFDTARLGIGGMSAGGMVTLHRLCRPHPFLCATVESTAGDFEAMESTRHAQSSPAHGFYVPELVRRLNPITHLDGWRPLPFLALHSEKDEWVPVHAMRRFIDELRTHYAARHADPDEVTFRTWPETGAPAEHAGFGRFSNDAKNLQLDFLLHALEP